MNLTPPPTALGDIASSTTSIIGSYGGIAALVCGVLLAFFVAQFLIVMAGDAYDRRHPPAGGVPLM